MSTIIITGGSGLIGTALSKLLSDKGYDVIILTRKSRPATGRISFSEWDPSKGIIDRNAIERADAIVHLAGAGVADKRWSDKRKKEIVDSRVQSSQLIVKSLAEIPNHVECVVSAAGIGWYGPDSKDGKAFIESDEPASDFLGQTCVKWEQSIMPVTEYGKRLVILRTGIVLSRDGGAYAEFVKPMKAAVAGILGSGKQVVSWIHIDDICRVYLEAIEKKHLHGVYNAVAPETVTNKELVLKIAKSRKRPFIPMHVPEFGLKILLGEMSIEVLKSATVDDSKLRNAGFRFLFPSVDAAVGELERKEEGKK